MIISEKQIQELILIANLYIRILENLSLMSKNILSQCGEHNKLHVAKLLMEITSQQSDELKVIE